MRFAGTLRCWNGDRGFGFIEPARGGEEIFVHIKAFPSGSGRPVVGQRLHFEVEVGPQGKKRARAVQVPVACIVPRRQAPTRSTTPARWTVPRLLVLPVFAALWFYVASRWPVPLRAAGLYAGLSALTFIAYGLDKSAAIGRRWRTPEKTLHLLGLAGGWPGALLAQQLLRHKTSKSSFVAVFWCTVVLNIGAFVGWHAGLLDSLARGP